MNPKPNPNRQQYMAALRRMSPGERLKKALEMSDFGWRLFRQTLRRQYPDLSEEAFHQLYLDRQAKCHNRNY